VQNKKILTDYLKLYISNKKKLLATKKVFFQSHSPRLLIKNKRIKLNYINDILNLISPEKLLSRGFTLISDMSDHSIYSVKNIRKNDLLKIQFYDGKVIVNVDSLDDKI